MVENFGVQSNIIHKGENSLVFLEKEKICIKYVVLPKCIARLENEAKCLELLNGYIAPKMIEYDCEKHSLRMEFIEGLPLPRYVNKYGKIPTYFFAKLVNNFINLLERGIDYGEDIKFGEHFLIDEKNQDIRIIDFGISEIIQNDNHKIVDMRKKHYKSQFAFVFKESSDYDVEQTKAYIYYEMLKCGISREIVDEYFKNYDKI